MIKGYPTDFIKLCVVPFNSDDPTAEPTTEQIEMLEPFRAELEAALHQFRPTDLSDGMRVDHHCGSNVIWDARQTVLQIRPYGLRNRFEEVINKVANQFDNEWEQCRRHPK